MAMVLRGIIRFPESNYALSADHVCLLRKANGLRYKSR
jgi:hypothetical protein